MALAVRASTRPAARKPRGNGRTPLHIVANRIDEQEPEMPEAAPADGYDLDVLQRTLELVTVVIRAEWMRAEDGRAPQFTDFSPGE